MLCDDALGRGRIELSQPTWAIIKIGHGPASSASKTTTVEDKFAAIPYKTFAISTTEMSKHVKESVSSVPVLVVPKKASDDIGICI